MSTWTLAEIRQKVRQVTGRLSSDDLSNTQIDDYINKYYQFTFPAELKLESKLEILNLNTEANVQTYDLPAGFTNPVSPGTMDELNLIWYQDPILFRRENVQNVTRQISGVGDGIITAFALTAQQFPIIAGTVIVTDDVEIFTDNGLGILTGNAGGSGTVVYATGAMNVTFAVAPLTGQNIIFSFKQFLAGRPIAVLWFDDQFTFAPIPNTTYRFKCQGYATVTPLVNSTDKPELEQWGPGIAYGAARDIHADAAEYDAYQNVTALYKEQLAYILRRTHQNLLNIRAQPNF